MHTLSALVATGLTLVGPVTNPDVRGLRVERPLQGAASLPEGSVGGHPLDALTPGWPFCHLVIEADLGDPEQADVVEDLLPKAAKFDARVRTVIVDLGERDANELDVLLWERGWFTAEVGFATAVDPETARGEPGWHLHRPAPELGDVGVPVPPIAVVDGPLESASAIAKAVATAVEERSPEYQHLFSSSYLKNALELDFGRLEKLFAPMEAEAGPNGITSGEPLTLKLLVTTTRATVPHLLAEAELAWRMGQPADAAARLEELEELFGDHELAAGRREALEALGLDRDAVKAGDKLAKLLGKQLGRNPERLAGRLDAFIEDGDAPEPVLARAAHYRALLEQVPE